MAEPTVQHAFDRYALWVGGNVLLLLAVAWVAFQIQQEQIAPVVLFPLLVGGVLGAAGGAIARYTHVPAYRGLLVGAAVWGLLAVLAQDYIGHRYRLRLYDEELGRQNPLVALAAAEVQDMRPDFGRFLTRVVGEQPVWWGLDLLLTSGASVAVTALVARRKDSSVSRG